jgi:4-amino-4-deoxy-L-arabinose transferase-like glycosyltransferase
MLWLLLITVVVRLPTMFWVKRTGWDEHAYAFFAHTLDEGGVGGIRRLIHDYGTDENLSRSPLPLRVGFIVPAALVCKALGGFNVTNLAWLAFFSGIALVLIGAAFAQELFGQKVAMICATFLIASPLAAALSRRAMQDSYAALAAIACLYFFHQCWRRRQKFDCVALGVALSVALLTKESLVLIYPMMGLAALYYWRALKLRASPWLMAPLCIAPLIFLLIEIWICGGIGNLIATYQTYTSLQQTLAYTSHYEKGPWFSYLLGFLAISPLIFIAAIVGFAIPAPDRATHHGRALTLIFCATGVLLFAQLPVINLRLVLFLDIFLRMAAALAVIYLASPASQKTRQAALIGVIAILVLADIAQFYYVFTLGGLYNPNIFLLLRAEGFYDVPL